MSIPVAPRLEINGDLYVPLMSRHFDHRLPLSTDIHAVSPGGEVLQRAAASEQILQDSSHLPHVMVVFAGDSGCSRQNLADLQVSQLLNSAGVATLVLDLLMPDEIASKMVQFDVPSVSHRLTKVMQWLKARDRGPGRARVTKTAPINTREMKVGIFASGHGAAAAVATSVKCGETFGIRALVSLGGRLDTVQDILSQVQCPVLLMSSQKDNDSVQSATSAFYKLTGLSLEHKQIDIVDRAESGVIGKDTMDTVAKHALAWFEMHMK